MKTLRTAIPLIKKIALAVLVALVVIFGIFNPTMYYVTRFFLVGLGIFTVFAWFADLGLNFVIPKDNTEDEEDDEDSESEFNKSLRNCRTLNDYEALYLQAEEEGDTERMDLIHQAYQRHEKRIEKAKQVLESKITFPLIESLSKRVQEEEENAGSIDFNESENNSQIKDDGNLNVSVIMADESESQITDEAEDDNDAYATQDAEDDDDAYATHDAIDDSREPTDEDYESLLFKYSLRNPAYLTNNTKTAPKIDEEPNDDTHEERPSDEDDIENPLLSLIKEENQNERHIKQPSTKINFDDEQDDDDDDDAEDNIVYSLRQLLDAAKREESDSQN